MSLALLRQQLAELAAPAAPRTRGLPTGLAELDLALPSGGLPRGRLTELIGVRGSGKTSVLREIVAETLARGEWVAYIDATRTLAPRDWVTRTSTRTSTRTRTSTSTGDGLWVIRPNVIAKGAWCADVLLRSGAFGLVILDGAPPLSRSVAARLVRLARECDAALIVTGEEDARAAALPAALLLRIDRPRRRRPVATARARQVVITVERGAGRRRVVEVSYVVRMARRMSTDSEVADRRGVERAGGARTERSESRDTARPPAAPHRDLGKRRRCAEPDYEKPAAERKRRALAAMG
jgi:hypothetical protein